MSEQLREPLLEVKDLRVEFDVRAGIVKAVDGLTMTINRGKTLGDRRKWLWQIRDGTSNPQHDLPGRSRRVRSSTTGLREKSTTVG
jgi:hypothetical protein